MINNKNIWKKIDKNKIEKEKIKLDLETFISDNDDGKKEKLIEIINLEKKYHDLKNKDRFNLVFSNVSFNIYKNEKLGIIGANGAGKTTIIEILCGFKKQTSGKINKFFDKNLDESKKMGVQFQDLSFPKNLSVKDIINFSINLDKSNLKEQELLEMLQVFKLDSIINKKASKLSGGQQQRLNVIISLISKPKLLFLDEFTSGLDISIKKDIKNFILDYCEKNKITLVVISHDIEIMNQMIDRVILIGNNKLLINASLEDINKKFGSLNKLTDLYI